MNDDPTTFSPDDKADDAASAFERYDLITAPVVDLKGKLMGRLTVESIVDFVNEDSDANLRRMGGISPEEDVFSPVGKAVKNRWAWLAINLCTAFVASRVIGLFEHTISELVALAALMPIVAGIGGNTGNQTITMIVRGLALHQVQLSNMPFLLLRELGVALINGLIWGGLMGVVTWLLYGNMAMGAVMTLAMVLNLLVAALMGVLIPLTMVRLGRDPALGSSVMITALTDTGGFFIFLGLATIFLL
jgi:magnesium transporter